MLSATLSQRDRLIKLEGPPGFPNLLVQHFSGEEGINSSFFFELECYTTDAHISLKRWLGSPLCLSIRLANGEHRRWQTRLASTSFVSADGGLARYDLSLQAWFSFLGIRKDSHIFQDKTVQEIAEGIFAEYAPAPVASKWRFDLSRQLRPRSLCTQYRESDQEFICRLFAEEGLSFRFEHEQTSASGGHVLVVFDNESARPEALQSPIRFHRADGLESSDSVMHWSEHQAVKPNASVLSSWDYKRLASVQGQSTVAETVGDCPPLELYDGSGAYRHGDNASATQASETRLQCANGPALSYTGTSNVRRMTEGSCFSLTEHDGYPEGANRFMVTGIHHEAFNNFPGNTSVDEATQARSEHGIYRNRFSARSEFAPLNPPQRRRPTTFSEQVAVVVGIENEPITTERDHRVKVQFPWQRGASPLPGGLIDTGKPSADVDQQGNAPRNDRSGTWIRVSQALAGANWGSVFVPRIGMEVLVGFIEGDIDRPLVVQVLHHDSAPPPFSAGVDSGVNHPGTIKGWHSNNLGGDGWNQWIADDASAQLRTRLASSHASSYARMGYDISQNEQSAQRGSFRGEGFELRTDGWTVLRAAKGVLLSASARPQAASTQLDIASALGQLKQATDGAHRLESASTSSGTPASPIQAALKSHDALLKGVDSLKEGKHLASVNQQAATQPSSNARTGGDVVEAFASPLLMMDAPSQMLFATPASSALFAGGDIQGLVQGDRLETAAHTASAVAGESITLFAAQGGLQSIAAHGPVSMQAHTDQLEILADQALTVTSSNARIEVNCQGTLTLQAGQSAIVLDGGNIQIKCPGDFQALGGAKQIGNAGDAQPADLPALPRGQAQPGKEPNWLDLELRGWMGQPIKNRRFSVTFTDGSKRSGILNSNGYAHLENVPELDKNGGEHRVEYVNPPSSEDPPADTLADLEQAIKQFLGS